MSADSSQNASNRAIEIDLVVESPTHRTLRAAVQAAGPRTAQAKEANSAVRGRRVTRYAFYGEALELELESLALRLEVTERGVDWRMLDREVGDAEPPLPDEVRLAFRGSEWSWRWRATLDDLIGRRLSDIAPSEVTVFLCFDGQLEIMFMGYRLVLEGSRLLVFSEA